ncbi:glycosyltransferase family 2 protein [Desulfobaculum bizertense]|uniref:Glycosyl transferase family 2 n=1 Tax=Desulfobaculum bizertense DSM 18034 TaxID=1121442 RepID=A0A1T4WZN6_9BACT|nr:glycosyltransferase family 2 protein [Desulfobaculum bizertense]SKA82338.1 Glycosyl transferase family 2 [Desulfobaculum bizertense DSM 18034]
MLPLLTIAIPTFNRAVHLEILLQHLLPQINDQIEVLITDNASEDNTSKVIREYCNQSPRLKAIRHHRNIGFNGNYKYIFEAARGEWLWIIGDDEIPSPNLVHDVLEEIAKNRTDIILLGIQKYNTSGLYGDPLKIFSPPYTHGTCLECKNDNELIAYLERIINLAGSFSFLSNICQRTDLASSVPMPPDLERASSFPQTYRGIFQLKNQARITLLTESIIYSIKGNDSKKFQNLIQRALLDLREYNRLSKRLFPREPKLQLALSRCAARETSRYVSENVLILLVQRIFSETDSWNEFSLLLKQVNQDNYRISKINSIPSWIWNILHYVSLPFAPLLQMQYKSWTTPKQYIKSFWNKKNHEKERP